MSGLHPQLQQPGTAISPYRTLKSSPAHRCSAQCAPRPVLFASPLKYFQAHQNNDPLEEILAPTAGFFLPPEALRALQRETSSAELMLEKGKAPSTRQRWEKQRPWAGGWEPALTASSNRCVFALNTHLRKIFLSFSPCRCLQKHRPFL